MRVTHTACGHCGQDIEGPDWRDRGNNRRCPDDSGRMHEPGAVERCRACLGMGYKGRQRPSGWKIETCRACLGRGEKFYRRPQV